MTRIPSKWAKRNVCFSIYMNVFYCKRRGNNSFSLNFKNEQIQFLSFMTNVFYIARQEFRKVGSFGYRNSTRFLNVQRTAGVRACEGITFLGVATASIIPSHPTFSLLQGATEASSVI